MTTYYFYKAVERLKSLPSIKDAFVDSEDDSCVFRPRPGILY